MKAALYLSLLLASPLGADTTFLSAEKHAWSANTGWIDFAGDALQGVVAGESYFSGYAWSANTGFINFGNGSPTNGHTYSNTDAADFGVNHDGTGNLAGYAWSANTGWINFGWATPTDPKRPRFDLQTGNFSGFAWSANTGWVNLGAGYLTTSSMARPDSDNDGIADHWEHLHFLGLGTAGIGTDQDKDGVTDAAEYAADTNPKVAADTLRIISQSYSEGLTKATLEFTSKPSRLYRMQFSNDLGAGDPWADSPFGIFAPDAGTTTTKAFNFPANPTKFFRAVAVLPLLP